MRLVLLTVERPQLQRLLIRKRVELSNWRRADGRREDRCQGINALRVSVERRSTAMIPDLCKHMTQFLERTSSPGIRRVLARKEPRWSNKAFATNRIKLIIKNFWTELRNEQRTVVDFYLRCSYGNFRVINLKTSGEFLTALLVAQRAQPAAQVAPVKHKHFRRNLADAGANKMKVIRRRAVTGLAWKS